MRFTKVACAAAITAAAFLTPYTVSAESAVATGAAAASGGAGAAARVDFQIVIPAFINFRVGSAGGTIDLIEFQPTAADVLAGTAGTAATAGSGDLGNGDVTVSLISNAGAVSITSSTAGVAGLDDGSGNKISYAQIQTADGGTISAPALADNATNTVAVPVSAGVITNKSDVWTYTYDNPAVPPVPGTYGGVNTNDGRATYTAFIP